MLCGPAPSLPAACPAAPRTQAVAMFKELDLREAGGTYFSDVVAFCWRLLDVAFFDIQLAASVVHGNRRAGAARRQGGLGVGGGGGPAGGSLHARARTNNGLLQGRALPCVVGALLPCGGKDGAADR
jgi:hypothetical protein